LNGKNILQFSIGPIGAAALSFITLPIISWFFSIEDIGRLAMLQVYISFSVTIFSLGMHQAYVREYFEVDDKAGLLKMAVLPGLVLLMMVVFIIGLSPFSISNLAFDVESTLISSMLFLSILAAFLINFLTHVLRMQERGLAFSATQVIPKTLFLGAVVIIISLNFECDFENLILAMTAATYASLIGFSWFCKASWLPAITAKIDRDLLLKMLRFSLPLVAGGLAYWGLTTMDRFFLRALTSFEELGLYAVAVSFAGVAAVFSTIFSNLWHPIVFKWIKKGVEHEKVQVVIENMFLGVTFIWTILGTFSWLIPYLLPSSYLSIEYLIVACAAAPLLYMLSETTVVGIGVMRRTSFSMLASVVAFIVNAVLNYFLIVPYGASGAAMATALAFFIFFMIRTESSAYLWREFPRVKIYIMTIAYLVATIVMVITKAKIDYYFVIWLLLFALSLFVYKDRVVKSLSYLKTYRMNEI